MAAVIFVGLCQLLATSPWLDADLLPRWLGGVIAIVGFLAFLLLTGLFGNSIAAVALFLLAWRSWRWPLWLALLWALPFGIVAYRVMPKPW